MNKPTGMTIALFLLLVLPTIGCGGSDTTPGTTGGTPSTCAAAGAVPKAGALADYNLALLNAYRSCGGVGPLTRDTAPGAPLDAYATTASAMFAASGGTMPHAYWNATPYPAPYNANKGLENQGWSFGQPTQYDDVFVILEGMYNEGPGGGHHDAMMNATYTRVGIGFDFAMGRVWLTNDFTDLP